MSRPRALDLFCCGGGVSEGLRRAGFEVVGIDLVDHSRIYRAGPGRLCLENPATFIQADALEFMEAVIRGEHGHFELVCASPPCQAHSSLRHLQQGKEYPDLIPQTRALLQRWGGLWCIENVPGAPLGGAHLTQLCGTMFGLQTPDGRAELRRHRLFETSFSIPLRPACQHGHESLSVYGSGLDSGKDRYRKRAISITGHAAEISPSNWPAVEGGPEGEEEDAIESLQVILFDGLPVRVRKVRTPNPGTSRGTVSGDRPNSANTPRKVLTVTGHTPVDNTGRQTISVVEQKGLPGLSRDRRKVMTVAGATPQRHEEHNVTRETFSTADARAAMGIDWMPMKQLSQAIPPAYAEWIGRQALEVLGR